MWGHGRMHQRAYESPRCANPVTTDNRFSNARLVEFFDGILKVHPQAPTSTAPLYSNAAFQILGYALEEITEKSFETLMEDELIKPLNLTRSSYSHPSMNISVIPDDPISSQWNADTKGMTPWVFSISSKSMTILISYRAGGLYSSSKDMAAIGRAILNSTLLPPAVTRRWVRKRAILVTWYVYMVEISV